MLNILIADDHALLRKGLRDLLETRADWRVCAETGDGLQAVALSEALHPGVAVLDVLMPGLDGFEAARRIREVSPPTQVLILSGDSSPDLAGRTTAAGACALVDKSNAEATLIPAIEALSGPAPCGPDRVRSPWSRLTPREREITRLLADGKSNWMVATILGISIRTVETHRSNVMQKLGLESVVELVHYAIRSRLVEP